MIYIYICGSTKYPESISAVKALVFFILPYQMVV